MTESDDDYRRVARAIEFILLHRREQPGLEPLAAHLGLSPAHLQRLFSRWAGISPKRFLQFLTVEYAKRRMAETSGLLQLALDAGLSGPGRLHDLFVTMEAMSPGEYRRAATGLTIDYGSGDTPFGAALVAATDRGICHLSFLGPLGLAPALAALQRQWPGARLRHRPAESAALLRRIFTPPGAGGEEPLSLWVSGSNFQVQVWRALLAIPFSGLLSYGELSGAMGLQGAARAVGNALAANPVAYLIPCHRVLRQTGDFGRYHWGTPRKAAMAGWEASLTEHQVEPPPPRV